MTHIKLFSSRPGGSFGKNDARVFAADDWAPLEGFPGAQRGDPAGLQQLFYTKQPVFVSTSSAWGVMEGAIRNLVSKKVLNCMSGAFSDKWFDVAKKCGKQAEALQVEWGQPILPEAIEAKLATGEFDAVTLIHNETSTGTMNPLSEIAAVMKKFPDVQFIVDCVSSFTAMKIPFDELGIDVMLAGTQKALALPAGAAVFAVSEKAYAKAATIKDRGYYFDFLEFKKNQENEHDADDAEHLALLRAAEQAGGHLRRGPRRPLRAAPREREAHARLGGEARLQPLPEGGLRVDHADLRARTTRTSTSPKLISTLKTKHSCIIDGGYGKIKGTSFRISHHGRREHGEHPAAARLAGWVLGGTLAQLRVQGA